MRENGGHAVALHWSMRNLYGINPGEVTKYTMEITLPVISI